MMFEEWGWVQHIIFGSSLGSWPSSQPMNGFHSGIAIFMKIIDFQPIDDVYFHINIVENNIPYKSI